MTRGQFLSLASIILSAPHLDQVWAIALALLCSAVSLYFDITGKK